MKMSEQAAGAGVAAKQEWPNGDEERVECAIHFVITQQIPSKLTVTLLEDKL